MTHEARQYLIVRITIGLFVALVSLSSVILIARAWPLLATANQARSGCGCTAAVTSTSTPTQLLSLGVIALSVTLLGSVLWQTGRSLWRQWRYQRQVDQRLLRKTQHHSTGQILSIIDDYQSQAFTLGFWRPRIYLTIGLLRQLKKSEVQAVIAHEAAHARARDPLVAALIEAVGQAWGRMPWIRSWVTAATNLRELTADAAATSNYRQIDALAGAVSKLVESSPVALAAMSPNTSRVEKLLNHQWQPSWRLWRWQYVAGALGLILGLVLLGRVQTAMAKPSTPGLCHQQEVMCRQQERLRLESLVCAEDPSRCYSLPPTWTSVRVIQLMSVDAHQ